MIRIKALFLPPGPVIHIRKRKIIAHAWNRLNSTKAVVEQRNKNDIESWVRNNLYEQLPTPIYDLKGSEHLEKNYASRTTQFESHSVSFVPNKNYILNWQAKFHIGDPTTVKYVLDMALNQRKIFTLKQLMPLLYSLNKRRNFYDIDRIYDAYEKSFPAFTDARKNTSIEHRFLELIMGAEVKLGNYKLCERLFSEYIKCRNVKPEMVSIGLRSFVENGNLQFAKEFYIQALQNPDAFPMKNKELFLFIRDLSRHNDVPSMKYVFNLWLTEKCTDNKAHKDLIPDFNTLSLLHQTFRLHHDENGLETFLNNDIVHKAGYPNSIFFKITELCQDLQDFPVESIEDENQKINSYLNALKRNSGERRYFYLSLLRTSISINDTPGLKYIMELIKNDKEINFDGEFHLVLANYFVKCGLLDHLMEYYTNAIKTDVKSSSRFILKLIHIQQLWDCALRNYPILSKEITNELKILLNREEYFRKFPRLNYLLNQAEKMSTNTRTYVYENFKPRSPQIYHSRLNDVRDQISRKDIVGAKVTILQNLRHGIIPDFDFYFSALKLCLESDMPSLAKILEDSYSGCFHKIPLKVNISWLRYEVLTKYKALLSKKEIPSLASLQPLKDQVIEFKRMHMEEMNFQNFLQLAQLCIKIRDYKNALLLLLEAHNIIDQQNRQQWIMYYMTALKIYARSYRVVEFHATLKHWNNNPHAKHITHDCIRQIKSFSKLFNKRYDKLIIVEGTDPDILRHVSVEIGLLVERFANYKFDGLNAMKKLTFFIKKLIEDEIKASLEKEIAKENK